MRSKSQPLVNPVKVSTLQPDVEHKERIGIYFAISAIILIIFAFLLVGVITSFRSTGDIGAIIGLCSLIPISIGGLITVRGMLAYRNQPPQVINVEARITRIDKSITPAGQALFIPVLSYPFKGTIIENPCQELAHTVPDYHLNDSITVPIDTTNPYIYWIESKPRPIIPKMIPIGFTILGAGLLALILPIFI